jgi:hypothetical protein
MVTFFVLPDTARIGPIHNCSPRVPAVCEVAAVMWGWISCRPNFLRQAAQSKNCFLNLRTLFAKIFKSRANKNRVYAVCSHHGIMHHFTVAVDMPFL